MIRPLTVTSLTMNIALHIVTQSCRLTLTERAADFVIRVETIAVLQVLAGTCRLWARRRASHWYGVLVYAPDKLVHNAKLDQLPAAGNEITLQCSTINSVTVCVSATLYSHTSRMSLLQRKQLVKRNNTPASHAYSNTKIAAVSASMQWCETGVTTTILWYDTSNLKCRKCRTNNGTAKQEHFVSQKSCEKSCFLQLLCRQSIEQEY